MKDYKLIIKKIQLKLIKILEETKELKWNIQDQLQKQK